MSFLRDVMREEKIKHLKIDYWEAILELSKNKTFYSGNFEKFYVDCLTVIESYTQKLAEIKKRRKNVDKF